MSRYFNSTYLFMKGNTEWNKHLENSCNALKKKQQSTSVHPKESGITHLRLTGSSKTLLLFKPVKKSRKYSTNTMWHSHMEAWVVCWVYMQQKTHQRLLGTRLTPVGQQVTKAAKQQQTEGRQKLFFQKWNLRVALCFCFTWKRRSALLPNEKPAPHRMRHLTEHWNQTCSWWNNRSRVRISAVKMLNDILINTQTNFNCWTAIHRIFMTHKMTVPFPFFF